MKILLVEDDSGLADMVRRTLTEAGYAADVAFDAPSGIEAFEIDPTYDLVILDLMLPGLERGGMAVCERIRELSSGVPVLMLTALDSMRTKVQGLDAGADDYVVKPFHVAELLARVRALLRRSPTAHAPVLSAGCEPGPGDTDGDPGLEANRADGEGVRCAGIPHAQHRTHRQQQ